MSSYALSYSVPITTYIDQVNSSVDKHSEMGVVKVYTQSHRCGMVAELSQLQSTLVTKGWTSVVVELTYCSDNSAWKLPSGESLLGI